MRKALILAAAFALAQAQVPAPVGGDMSNTTTKAIGSTTARTLADRATDFGVNVQDFGASNDGTAITDSSVVATAGGSTVTTVISSFTSNNVGNGIFIQGAGAAGTNYVGTITAVGGAHSITVSPNIGTTISGTKDITWGTDNTTAINAALDRARALAPVTENASSVTITFPPGQYYRRITTQPTVY